MPGLRGFRNVRAVQPAPDVPMPSASPYGGVPLGIPSMFFSPYADVNERAKRGDYGPMEGYPQSGWNESKSKFRGPRRPRSLHGGGALNQRTGGFVGIEKKFIDHSYTASVAFTTDMSGCEADPAGVNCINGVAVGTGEDQRVGRKAWFTDVYVTGVVELENTSLQTQAPHGGIVTIYVVLDKQTNGAQMASEDMFCNPSADGRAATTPFHNLQYSDRFKVLGKKTLTFPPSPCAFNDGVGTASTGANQKKFKIYKKLKLECLYKGTDNTVASIMDNSVHVIMIASAGASTFTTSYNSRMRFTS